MNNLTLINTNGKFTVDSREVAEMVDKQHSHLLRDIKGYKEIIDLNPNLDSANFFIESDYMDAQCQLRLCYKLTRKGCDMVANKMTGEKGVLFTATYVTKFEEMEKKQAPIQLDSKFLFLVATQLEEKEKQIVFLGTENKLLAQQNLQWADRNLLNAIVKAYGARIGFEDGWRDFKKELLYQHGININLRITNRMNDTGKKTKPATLTMIHDDEVSKCVSTAVALCKSKSVDISSILNKFTELKGA